MINPLRASILLFVLCLGAWSLPLHAAEPAAVPDPETMKAAEELIDSMDMGNMINKSMESALEGQMSHFADLGLPAEGVAELKDAMLGFVRDVMNWDDLRPEFIRLYAETFTAAELREIGAFYKTPTGRKALEKMPVMMNKGMEMAQKRMMQRQDDLQKMIGRIMEKYMNADE